MGIEATTECDCGEIVLKLGYNGDKIDLTKVHCPRCQIKFKVKHVKTVNSQSA